MFPELEKLELPVNIQNVSFTEIVNSKYRVHDSIKFFRNFGYERYKDFHFLVAFRGHEVVGYYVKQAGITGYQNGYLESAVSGTGSKLIAEMSKNGSFVSFARICNVRSLKAQLKAKPLKIKGISEKYGENSKYEDVITKDMFYKSELGSCGIIHNGELNPELSDFILNSKKVVLMHGDKESDIVDIGRDIDSIADVKIYFQY